MHSEPATAVAVVPVSAAAPLTVVSAPLDDRLWFAQLPADERQFISRRRAAFRIIEQHIDRHGRIVIHAGAIAAHSTFGAVKGFSVKNLSKSYRDWLAHGRDDRRLADWAKHPWLRDLVEGKANALPTRLHAAFIEFCGGKFLEHKRSFASAYRAIVRDWQSSWHTGQKLPGIMADGTPGSARDYWRTRDVRTLQYDHCPPDLPPGWTKGNLERAVLAWCQITPAEIALARRGTAAMRDHLPTIHSTRREIEYGLHLFTDDLQHDYEVIAPAGSDPFARPLEIGILELASAVYGPWVAQPAIRDPETFKRLGLGWENVKYVFGLWLEQNGIPNDHPIYLHVERGTATVHPDEAKLWHDMSEGVINICYTEMQGRYCLAWDESRKGNFRGKAALESAWNLHHNYADHLPTYLGRNRDNHPAITQGQKRETLALLQWAASLPAAQRGDLQLPTLSWEEWTVEREDQIARINSRLDHSLEAFDQVTEWRPRGLDGAPWRSLAALEQVPLKLRAPEFIETRQRLESPLERKARLRQPARWSACPGNWLAIIYGFRARKMTVNKGTIHVERGTAHWFFMAESKAAQAAAGIVDGKEYMVAFNPHAMTCCHILDDKGGYRASWECRVTRRGNKDDAARSFAHRQGWQQEVIDKVERLLIASGQIVDTEIRRDFNRALGAPQSGRIELLSADPDSRSAGGADRASTATSEPADENTVMGGVSSPRLQARPFPDPNDAASPASSAPHQPARPSLRLGSGADEEAPALNPAPRLGHAAPSLSAQIAADAVKAQRATANKPRRHTDANARYRAAIKNL